ncbi:MAG: SCO family protein [Betaproteobacteria bacterium]|nr:SCO family protein [Betaproteobacteria bacterium]
MSVMRGNHGLAIAALFAAAAALPYVGLAHAHEGEHSRSARTGDARSDASRPAIGAVQRWRANYFPNVPLVTQDGRRVRFYDDLLKGKAVVINVIYTHCEDNCPLMTANLARVHQLLGERVGKEIFFYSISIDPKRDTPEVLKGYMKRFGVGQGWQFLTGKKEDIALIQKKLGLWSRTDVYDPDGHLVSLMVGNEPTGQWMRQSSVDNPRFLATKISTFLLGWKNQREAQGESYAAARPIEGMDAGSYLFRTRCSACHTIGKGNALGPDLMGVTRSRDRAWLARYIKTPDKVLAEKDPIALQLFAKYNEMRMPNLRLGDGDVEMLIRYLEAQGASGLHAERKNSASR